MLDFSSNCPSLLTYFQTNLHALLWNEGGVQNEGVMREGESGSDLLRFVTGKWGGNCQSGTCQYSWQGVEWARSARSTASTGPIVTIWITLISDPDTRIDGALMAASIMSRVPLRHQARPNMVCAHYAVCINMWSPALCNTSLLSPLPPSPLLIKPPFPLTPGKT